MTVAKRDPVRTKERILSMATAEFSAKGYDSARVDSIARRSKVSKNMLYHYFGSKEGLFVAVLERTYEGFRTRQRDLAVRMSDPEAALRQMAHHTFEALLENPHVIPLLNAENLHKGRHIARSAKLRDLYDPLLQILREVLDRGAAQGVFRPDIDPVTLYVTMSSLAYHFISNQYTLKAALGIDFTTPERRTEWRNHVSDLVAGFCRAEPAVATRRAARG